MSEQRMYEGLFLFPQSAATDLKGAVDHLNDLFERSGLEVVSLSKWDERRLAYEIKGNKRGVYFLAYLKAPPEALAVLERNCNLSERLLRSMMTRADHVPAETIEAAEGRERIEDEIKLRGSERKDAPEGGAEAAPAPADAAAAPAPAGSGG